MSRSWAKGSGRGWRRRRAAVLLRDDYRCQLRLLGCTGEATQVHHTLGRAITGDNMAYLVAACRFCNLRMGQPGKGSTPHKRVTQWSARD